MCASGEWARESRPERQPRWPVGGAGNSTVISEPGIKPLPQRREVAAYLLSETGKQSTPRVFHTRFLFSE